MTCKASFIEGFKNNFVQTDIVYYSEDSRSPHAKSAAKKFLLTPLYHPLSLTKALIDLIMTFFITIVFALTCSKSVVLFLGGVLGSIAHLTWSPIRATYLFFRSVYGILLPNHVAKVKKWETTFFQIKNLNPKTLKAIQEKRNVKVVRRLHFSSCSNSKYSCKVPSFLKYEA